MFSRAGKTAVARAFLKDCRSSQGMTLVEILLTVVIYALIVGGAYLALSGGTAAWQVNDVKVELNQELRKGLDTMTADLRQTGASGILNVAESDAWSNNITFRLPQSVDTASGTIIWDLNVTDYLINGDKLIKRYMGVEKVVAVDMKTLKIRRPLVSPNVIEVVLESTKETAGGRTVDLDLAFEVQLRN